jgi:acyl-CoA synthetase (AMP-forming)/AMP-acid ligase II
MPLPASAFRRDDRLAPMNLAGLRERISTKLHTGATLARVGVLRPHRPDRIVRTGLALLRWGPTPAAGYTASAARFPDEVAIIDDFGTLTFREVHERSNAVARALAEEGVGVGDGVAIMCRNHRGFIEATIAASKLGADAIFLNTAFSGPQLADVARRENPRVIVYDEEFEDVLEEAAEGRLRVVAWHEPGPRHGDGTLDAMVAAGDRTDLSPPPTRGKAILLTSGTTGTPKGASRSQPRSLDPAATLLSRIPLRAREKTMIAAPLFHTWGFAHFTLGMSLSSTVVLRRKFDPEQVLSVTARHECAALVVVPVMLQRILELDDEVLRRYDLSKLRVVPVSGSALPSTLARRWMDLFGENLFNLYGSTEVAWATIATPQDLREAPGTAGRPPRGTVVRIYDDAGVPVRPGETGRIFVGNEMQFEGYTGGGGKDQIDGLMNSGDVGHFDAEGRLFIDGRDDDMIISGGENVFPGEVEDLLSGHEAVAEVAVFGVADTDWGERLVGVIVRRPGASLEADDVREFVKGNLAVYKVPRDVHFVDELPRTATGKVLKRELRPH